MGDSVKVNPESVIRRITFGLYTRAGNVLVNNAGCCFCFRHLAAATNRIENLIDCWQHFVFASRSTCMPVDPPELRGQGILYMACRVGRQLQKPAHSQKPMAPSTQSSCPPDGHHGTFLGIDRDYLVLPRVQQCSSDSVDEEWHLRGLPFSILQPGSIPWNLVRAAASRSATTKQSKVPELQLQRKQIGDGILSRMRLLWRR